MNKRKRGLVLFPSYLRLLLRLLRLRLLLLLPRLFICLKRRQRELFLGSSSTTTTATSVEHYAGQTFGGGRDAMGWRERGRDNDLPHRQKERKKERKKRPCPG